MINPAIRTRYYGKTDTYTTRILAVSEVGSHILKYEGLLNNEVAHREAFNALVAKYKLYGAWKAGLFHGDYYWVKS